MGMILLEALGALLVLAIIVWWTMFAGRKGGERVADALPASPGAERAGEAVEAAAAVDRNLPAKPPSQPGP